MADFATQRRMMVDGQVRTADVTDRRLIGAMLDLPREKFVPEASAPLAYLDLDVPLADAQGESSRRLLKPMVLAKLVQALDIVEGQKVLDVGCATGYAAALMARLGANVVALEQDDALARVARTNLAGLAELVQGWLADGYPAGAPYDLILVEGRVEIAPEGLCGQLAEGGRLICIEGEGPGGKAMLYQREASGISRRAVFDTAGPALPGFVRPPAFVF
jgi:protein-L-isoaspartate(D-aspartate) O-methyltransferase